MRDHANVNACVRPYVRGRMCACVFAYVYIYVCMSALIYLSIYDSLISNLWMYICQPIYMYARSVCMYYVSCICICLCIIHVVSFPRPQHSCIYLDRVTQPVC